jgi:hypothetical protein
MRIVTPKYSMARADYRGWIVTLYRKGNTHFTMAQCQGTVISGDHVSVRNYINAVNKKGQ